jgi:YD repeat-containing protein
MNRPVSVQVPLAVGAITTTYGYDKNSNLTRVTDGKGAVTTYLYNHRNLQYRMIEPATTAFPAVADRTYNVNYDGGGLPFAETKPGTAIQRTFNPLGHPLTELWSGNGYAGVSKYFRLMLWAVQPNCQVLVAPRISTTTTTKTNCCNQRMQPIL